MTSSTLLEERSAVALVTISQTHELHPTDISAEPKTQFWSHWNLVFLGNFVTVPNLLGCLDIMHAPHPPLASDTPHRVDGVRPWEFQLTKRRHAANKARLKSLSFHAKTVAFEAISHIIPLSFWLFVSRRYRS
jgi:hypothetical protein